MKLTTKQLLQIIKEEKQNAELNYVKIKGQVQFPKPLDVNVNMMPFIVGDPSSLPRYLHGYLPMINEATFRKGSIAYLTVNESAVEKGKSQRRPGIHTDGTNGILPEDAKLENTTQGRWGGGGWGGGSSEINEGGFGGGWGGGLGKFGGGAWGGGHSSTSSKTKKTKNPLKESYSLDESKGIYIASSTGHCEIYDAYASRKEVDNHGGVLKESLAGKKCIKAQPNYLYWITDRTPHESMPMTENTYRQFFRLVSEDISVWYSQHSTPNPFGVKPNCAIIDADKFKTTKKK